MTSPIHPDLAPLATAAKNFHRMLVKTGSGIDVAGTFQRALRDAVGPRNGWLRPEHRVGDPARYMRHLLYVDPDEDFILTAICWLPGQQSPVHGHYVWCAFGVAEGELTEEQFRAPGNVLEPLGSRVIRAGELADELEEPLYHRVSNRGSTPLVSLHAYGVAASKLTTGINRIFAQE
jgi:predicted metal-dependent enzyme (double-stranded beta helix superfamily)